MAKYEFIKLLKAIIFCVFLCFLIALCTALILRSSFLVDMKAYLYRLLILDALCCIVLLAVVIIAYIKNKKFFNLELSSAVMCIVLSAFFMALFYSLGPMTIERSYTVYSLSDMADHAEIIYSAEDIKIRFIEGYVEGANASKKRIDEQLSIGNLEEVDGGYRITPKGERLIGLFRFIEMIFPVPDESSIYPNGH